MGPHPILMKCWLPVDSRGQAVLVFTRVFTVEPARLQGIVLVLNHSSGKTQRVMKQNADRNMKKGLVRGKEASGGRAWTEIGGSG